MITPFHAPHGRQSYIGLFDSTFSQWHESLHNGKARSVIATFVMWSAAFRPRWGLAIPQLYKTSRGPRVWHGSSLIFLESPLGETEDAILVSPLTE